MPRQNSVAPPAGSSIPPARSHSHAHQPQPSRYPREESRVGQPQYAAHHPAQGQTTRHQPTPSFPNNGMMIQTTARQYHPAANHPRHDTHAVQNPPLKSVRPADRSYPNAGRQANGVITENGRRVPPPVKKNQKQPDPGPPDGYIKENGREIPIWYNPPGIVDKDMTPVAQAEYDRIRNQIIHGRR